MDERTLSITNTLHHDHCYSHRIPYFSSHLPTEERSHDVPEAIEDSDLKSKDFSYDEDDLTCKEVMETEEEMDKRRLTDFNKKESEMELCKKDESKESYLDKLLKLNDAASLLTAIDDDIEKLMEKLEKHQKLDNNSDFDENACDINDDQCDFSPPIIVKKEKEYFETSCNIVNSTEGISNKIKIESKVCIKAEP